MTDYQCEKCSAPATLTDAGLSRSCKCVAPVLANMKAHAYGEGHTSVKPSASEQMVAAFRAIGQAVLRAGR